MDLIDRIVLVTGARRIGAAVAVWLAERGAHVAVSYNRSQEEAEAVVTAVVARGRRAKAYHVDLTVPEACRSLVDAVAADFGALDALVNMASTYVHRDLDAMSDADWERAMAVDLRATFACCHAAIPHMRLRRGGRIVNVSDWVAASRRPRYTGYLAYYVAKSGVIALTEALALELARDQILVNAIAPGPIVPPPETSEAERLEVARATPLGRWGGEDEIVKAIAALLQSDFITGETIRVDGGRHLK